MVIGNEAPDFTTDAFIGGKQTKISLQDYRAKWVILVFYSGDFTFV